MAKRKKKSLKTHLRKKRKKISEQKQQRQGEKKEWQMLNG